MPKESDVNIEKVGDSFILVCYVPRASYDIRPVYISSNPFGNTYRRNHEGDYLCTDAEVRRMFADAEHDRHSQDGRIMVGFNIDRDIDMESFRQYRQTFASLQPTHPWVGISDMDFMKKIGAYAFDYETGKEGFTMAGLLMFGNYDSITNIAANPYFFVDYREKIGTDDRTIRWTHRIYPDGLWEANLYQFYVKTYNRLIQALPRPFMIKEGIRQEETPAHDAVREALINCIVHEDITATGNIIVERTDDKLIFRNPGMMLVSRQQYFEGGRSICRNPILQRMFMRLGRSEKAGSGVDKIVSGWRYLGLPTPTVKEETRPDYVVLTLELHQEPPQEGQETPQEGQEPPQEGQETPQERQVTPQESRETPQGGRQKLKDQSKDSQRELRKEQLKIYCETPKTLNEILMFLGLKDRKNLLKVYINPMILAGKLAKTQPGSPTSRSQKYVSTGK